MIYRFIYEHEKMFPIEKMCKVLKVGRRSYYDWKSPSVSERKQREMFIKEEIKTIYFEAKQRYGSPRITTEMNAMGNKVSKVTVAKYMKQMGLRSKLSKKFKVTTDSNHQLAIMPDLLKRKFDPGEPGKVWVSDITYIRTKEGFIYLTTVIDLYDRKCIGWALSNGMSADETALAAFKMAVGNRTPQKGLIFHSDRGVQYASKVFANTLGSYKTIKRSMSRKGNCWDNAVAESFFKTLKTELVYGNKLLSKQQMKLELFQYIEIWYNKNRRHSALENKTIVEFWESKNNFTNAA